LVLANRLSRELSCGLSRPATSQLGVLTKLCGITYAVIIYLSRLDGEYASITRNDNAVASNQPNLKSQLL